MTAARRTWSSQNERGTREILAIRSDGVERIQVDDVWERLARRDGFTWIDVADCDEEVAAFLRDRFDLHPSSIQACRERSHLTTFHGYRDSWFVVVHRPLIRRAGHVHLLQLESSSGKTSSSPSTVRTTRTLTRPRSFATRSSCAGGSTPVG